jgi:hypothetical protein
MIARVILVLTVIGIAAGNALADGKFYAYQREKVPPGIPYQRAFLFFRDGTETLAVQSKYDFAQSASVDSIGWVVPVPNIPEVASMTPEATYDFFWRWARQTSAQYWRVSDMISLLFMLTGAIGTAIAAICIVHLLFHRPPARDARMWKSRFVTRVVALLCCGFLALISPSLSVSRSSTVEVVKSAQVGVYDVKVIKGDAPEPLMAWLTENGFRFGDTDRTAFSDYVARGWRFTVAKVASGPTAESKSVAAEGMAAPLVLKFQTDKPVYPLALTATAGVDTEVLIYTLSPTKLTCGSRLPLRHAREFELPAGFVPVLITSEEDELKGFFEGASSTNLMLCKFKGTLTPAQMKEDLVFEPAADNTPYHETRIVW